MKQDDVSIFSSVNNSYNSQLSPSISLITLSLYFLYFSIYFLSPLSHTNYLKLLPPDFNPFSVSTFSLHFLSLSSSQLSLSTFYVLHTFSKFCPLLSRSTVYYFLTVISLSTLPIYSLHCLSLHSYSAFSTLYSTFSLHFLPPSFDFYFLISILIHTDLEKLNQCVTYQTTLCF